MEAATELRASNGEAVGDGALDERRAAAEYREWNPMVERFIAARFGSLALADREDVRAKAWEDLYRHRRQHADDGDESYAYPIKYLLQAARNRGLQLRERQESRQTFPTDPRGSTLTALVGGDAAEEAIEALGEEELRGALGALSAEEQRVFFCEAELGMEAGDARALLGMRRKRYDLVHSRMLDKACELSAVVQGAAFQRHRALLVERLRTGELKPHQLLRARKLADGGDQELAAALRSFGHFAHALVAIVPASTLAKHLGAGEGLLSHLPGVGQTVRHGAGSVFARGESGETTLTQVAGSGTGRGAAVGGAGVFAKLAGPGGAVKIVTACLAGGAAAAGCVASGVIPGVGLPHLSGASGKATQHRAAQRASARVTPPQDRPDFRPPSPASVNPTARTATSRSPTPKPEPTTPATATTATTPTTVTTTPLAPSTPPVQQEFGVPSASSSSTSTPSGSSGSASGGGGGSPTEQEFGP
jgi:DNA-directed RNA polymerase specialized sigma24 family protein